MKKSRNLSTGTLTDAVKTALREEYNVTARPKLIVDWNLNRYHNPVATNTPSEDTDGFNIEVFPISSIVEPLRPTKGVIKALVGQAVVAAGYLEPNQPRFYSANRADTYKYWTSPVPTNASGNFPNHTDGLTVARPRVTYDKAIQANKIVIKLENTWATPKDFGIHISPTTPTGFGAAIGGGNNPVANDGTITLYYNGTAWVSTRPTTLVTTSIRAIELRVASMGPGYRTNGTKMGYYKDNIWYGTTGAKSNLNVIAIEAHHEVDLSNRLVSVSDTFDFSEKSQLYPLGTITSNTAEVTLANDDGIFNVENTDSPYYGLIEPNGEFNLEYIYTIGGIEHSVQQFKMYASAWAQSDDGTVNVSLEDYSKFLKEIKPRAFMVEEKTAPELIWRVLDSVGFVDYAIQLEDTRSDDTITAFWTTGDETVWEALDELSKATQTAIYFDNRGMLQVRRREAAFKNDTTADWNLLGVKRGNSLPDIMTWTPSSEYEANKIEVKYQNAKWKTTYRGMPAMNKVWEPDNDNLVVRSAPIKRNITNSSNYFYIDQNDVEFWPYEGKVEIDGEIIEFDGKEFVYYEYTYGWDDGKPVEMGTAIRRTAVVTSMDELKKYNRKSPKGKRGNNQLTGGLHIKNRGVWNTEQRNHSVDLDGWTTKLEQDAKNSGVVELNPPGLNHKKAESLMNINTPARMKDDSYFYWALRGSPNATSYENYGFRMKFNDDASSPHQIAGMAYQISGQREAGYYVELRLSEKDWGKENSQVSEVTIYSKKNGKFNVIKKAAATLIGKNLWYDVDIYHTNPEGPGQRITVWVNGQVVAQGNVPADEVHGPSGRFGLYARGRTNVDFEYVYATNMRLREPEGDFGFYDLKYGGVRGQKWLREHLWQLHDAPDWGVMEYNEKEKKRRVNKYFFDEFGPYAHEVREFDVKFEPNPVRYSYLFNTNDWYSAVIRYNGDPFGARFVIVNTSRENAILHGEDRLSYAGASEGVNQVCVVLGQTLEIADEEIVRRKNLPAIRSRGEIVSELSSRWIQSKSAARDLAIWMAQHWSDSVDEVEVEIFGNPLIELGDLVDIDFPRQQATPATHKYWVVSINNSFDNGISTRLTLRRKREATTIS